MCGILGAWDERVAADGGLFTTALSQLLHRGPDEGGQMEDGPLRLGIRRLAILDRAGGQQPVRNEDGSVVAVCNGEIYNYLELRKTLISRGHTLRSHSDTEVLVHLYEDQAEGLFASLRGMFALAIWDARRRRLLLGRDRFGKKPLYTLRTPSGGLLFASEIKALRVLAGGLGMAWDVEPQAIYDYLSLGVVPQPATAIRGVESLPAGSWMSFEGQRPEIRRYWSLRHDAAPGGSRSTILGQVRDKIAEAVALRLQSDVPVGLFLSGGLDSSVVAFEASRLRPGGVPTFTVQIADPALDESAAAARTARSLALPNTALPLRVAPLEELERMVRCFDQPFADPSAIPTLAVSRLARSSVGVVLNGDGGDEVFAGYRRYLAARFLDAAPWLAGKAGASLAAYAARAGSRSRRSPVGLAARLLRGAAGRWGRRYLVWTTDLLREEDKQRAWAGSPMRPTEDWIESLLRPGLSSLDSQMELDRQINLQSDLLVKMDISTMACSLEARSPLLDHELAELVAPLPASLKLRRWRLKAILREAYRGRLPAEVLRAKKRGFEVPLRDWLQNELHEITHDLLGSPQAAVSNFVRPGFVAELLGGSRTSGRNQPALVYALLVLELWLRVGK